MKIGNRYLYSNGRGNYSPVHLCAKTYIKKVKRNLSHNKYTTDMQREWAERQINSYKHGIGLRTLRKGLNSKLRYMAKQEIKRELNYA